LALRFTPSGELIEVEKQLLPDLRDRDDLEREVIAYFERTGATQGTIHVRRFSSGDPGSLLEPIEQRDGCIIGIEDLPYAAMEAAEEKQWLSSGMFVIDWGDRYYVSAEGYVFCT